MKYIAFLLSSISLSACHQTFTADNGSKIYQGAGAYITPQTSDKFPDSGGTK